MTAIPALTTTFTPSTSCTIDVYKLQYPDITCVLGTSLLPCEFFHLGPDSSTANCLPSGWSDSTAAYFSPGICPKGYTEACKSTVGDETRATCCPSGYQCQTETDSPWYTTDLCTYVMSTAQVFVYTTSIIGAGEVVSTVTDAEGLNAFGIPIRYHSTDFPSSTSTASSSSSTSSSKQTGSSSSAGSGPTGSSGDSTGNNGSSSSSSGLSSGAKAGIGIGVALGALAFIGAAVWLFLRKRRAAAAGATATGDSPPGGGGAGGPAVWPMAYNGSNTMSSPGSGVAYTAVSGGSPAPENQHQKYYQATSTPIAEAPGQSWTPPVELPSENQHQHTGLAEMQGNSQPEYR